MNYLCPRLHAQDKEQEAFLAANQPLTFEQLNQGYGYVLYSRRFNQPISGTLSIPGLRDYAVIYIDGEKVGELNRNTQTYDMEINVPFNATLQILVENMGRINYGSEIVHNTKGIITKPRGVDLMCRLNVHHLK